MKVAGLAWLAALVALAAGVVLGCGSSSGSSSTNANSGTASSQAARPEGAGPSTAGESNGGTEDGGSKGARKAAAPSASAQSPQSQGGSSRKQQPQPSGSEQGAPAKEGEVALTKDEFVRKADAACQRERRGSLAKVAAYVKSHRSQGQSKAELTARAVKAVVLSTVASEITAIRKIGAPSGEAARVAVILTALEDGIAEASKSAQEPVGGPEAFFADADRDLRAYGLQKCAKGG